MQTVILGAKGRLGQALSRLLGGDALALDRDAGDLTKPVELRRTLERVRARVIINTAAYTAVDRAEIERAHAFAVNAFGVRDLALICRDLDATLIHISTNYVFGSDGTRESPYTEADDPGPINLYGQSKLAGENFVRALCPKHFILRTCGLYGSPGARGRSDFVDAMLKRAMQGLPIRVVDDQICTPTCVSDLALAVQELLGSRKYGLYHLTNAGSCTWHGFANEIFAVMRMPIKAEAISSEQYPTTARRPKYSVLDNMKWTQQGFTPLRPWQEALHEELMTPITPVPAFSCG